MRFLKPILPCLAIFSIPGIWAFPAGNVTLTHTEPSTDIDNHLVQRAGPERSSPLGQLLTRTYNAGWMINPRADQNDQIRYVARRFGALPWEVSYWNPTKDLIISFVTAKGAGFVMIPNKLLAGCVTKNGPRKLIANQYRTTIYEPLFGSNGYLHHVIDTFKKDGKQDPRDWWFPDGLVLFISSQHRTTTAAPDNQNTPANSPAIEELTDDLFTLWTTGPQGEFDNILQQPNRFVWHPLSPHPNPLPFTSEKWTAQQGAAITWDPSAVKYEVWLGSADTQNPTFSESQAETGFTFQQWGYYPESVYPLSMPEGSAGPRNPGPGAGCTYICETN
ncbi:uncharacterized protein N7459_002939 [Penicillium hispanicum]|uniref:uncharacterized protein n=1 Tax=Penicillium hispanicum TaxID=1080232 RepID=UPI0025409174|nr:uncharacterized protein N7459_002939 [Penicillium hispanicum]KAJ5587174.1 hypothetical protein N7459_002939 [Penicillium hispanicum]